MLFYKIHSCGNDYIVVDAETDIDYSSLAVKICDRMTGVGAVGVIVVKNDPLELVLYNPNGQISSVNGSALCSFGLYCFKKDLYIKNKLTVKCSLGEIKIELLDEEIFKCRIEIGKPDFSNQKIFVGDQINSFGRVLSVEGFRLTTYSFYLNSIETVVFVESLDGEVIDCAKLISNKSLFKNGTNVNFVKLLNNGKIEVKSYKNKQGFVPCSSFGACASVVAGHKLEILKTKVEVACELENIIVDINRKGVVLLTSGATYVFEGIYKEE